MLYKYIIIYISPCINLMVNNNKVTAAFDHFGWFNVAGWMSSPFALLLPLI